MSPVSVQLRHGGVDISARVSYELEPVLDEVVYRVVSIRDPEDYLQSVPV